MTHSVPKILPNDIRIFVDGVNDVDHPVWGPDENLYFLSPSDRKILLTTGNGKVQVLCDIPGRPSGLVFDYSGTLFVGELDEAAVLRLSDFNAPDVFATGFEGKRFSGPKHLAALKNGDIIVSDPIQAPESDPGISSMYRIDQKGIVKVFVNEIAFPSGIGVSSTGSEVLICEARANRLLSFSLDDNFEPKDERIVRRFRTAASPNGLTMDVEGNVFVALPGFRALALIDSQGELTELYSDPDWQPTNVAFGGKDKQTVFVTSAANGTIYSFRHPIQGV